MTIIHQILIWEFGMMIAPLKEKGGESMPAINYLSELDKIKIKKDLRPIIDDMAQNQLYLALIYILDGVDLYAAMDTASATLKMRYK